MASKLAGVTNLEGHPPGDGSYGVDRETGELGRPDGPVPDHALHTIKRAPSAEIKALADVSAPTPFRAALVAELNARGIEGDGTAASPFSVDFDKLDKAVADQRDLPPIAVRKLAADSIVAQGGAANFALDPSPKPGTVPDTVIRELVWLKNAAMEASEDASLAVLNAAKNHGVRKGALSKYVAAVAADKVSTLDRDTASLRTLLGAVDIDPVAKS